MILDHPKGVTRVLWTKDPNFVVTGCEDGHVRTWDLRSGEVTQSSALGAEVADLDFRAITLPLQLPAAVSFDCMMHHSPVTILSLRSIHANSM